MKKKRRYVTNPSAAPLEPLWIFLLVIPFLGGGFYEPVSCLCSIYLIGYLIYCQEKAGGLRLYWNLVLASTAVLAVFYGFSALWAVDTGMALLGFVKFLPMPLFVLAVLQLSMEKRESLLTAVPISGTVMTFLSFGLGQLPALRQYLVVNERLAGFFQYPNACALYLLAGVILLLGDRRPGVSNRTARFGGLLYYGGLFVLIFGIALSGSRTVFFLLAAVLLTIAVFGKERHLRYLVLTILAALIGVTAVYALTTGNLSTVGRYLTSSFGSSTLLGRFLYAKDAVPVILKHPFGLGYLGYFYTQGSFQTGVYSVRNVHNELLQLFLDIGWIPAVLFAVAVGKSIFAKGLGLNKRLLLAAISVHCLLDFDLQFLAVGFVLILAMDLEPESTGLAQKKGKHKKNIQKNRIQKKRLLVAATEGYQLKDWRILLGSGILLGAVSLWLGTASLFYYCESYELAVRIYPGYTEAWKDLLTQAGDVTEMERLADKILSQNESVSLAYSAKARAAYAEGDFGEMIRNKQRAIALSRYELAEYLDYFDMLYVGIQLYSVNGDMQSAAYCRERLLEIPDMLEEVLKQTSALAWRIHDKPELELPEEYMEMLEEL